MKVIGIIGGVASGKSAVADLLVEWGAERFDADAAGHEALRQPAVIHQLVKRWGEGILDAEGQVQRPVVAGIVFEQSDAGREQLQFLNFVTHPWIRAAFERQRDGCEAPALLVDAALLLEANWDRWCDEVIFVDADETLRRRRAEDRGWSEQQWHARESSQLPLAEKRARATHSVTNNGTLDELRARLEALRPVLGL
ncbi:MAG: dephospho-CoA kinase [Planctomycetales bacterium]|nr:dephospho-CoA kinase [Planctomycetales bacterium]